MLIERAIQKGDSCPVLEGLGVKFPHAARIRYSRITKDSKLPHLRLLWFIIPGRCWLEILRSNVSDAEIGLEFAFLEKSEPNFREFLIASLMIWLIMGENRVLIS